jgi:TatD DNase family protein
VIDTHVNLHAEVFADDLDAMLARARGVGVTGFVAICDRYENLAKVRAIAHANPDIGYSAGAHPHYAKDHGGLTISQLVAAAEDPKMVAVGETGLDQHYGYSDLDDQVAVFRTHIAASRATGLPLIVHTREADAVTAQVLEEEHARGAFPILLHCYTSGVDLARRGLALGAYVSASGIVSFRNAHDVRAIIAEVPADRLIVETDCPYLAPVPHRGRRNEPAFLPDVITATAACRGEAVEAVREATTANALRLFSRFAAILMRQPEPAA